MSSLLSCFKDIEDPRVNRTKKHNLLDVIAITIIGTLGGAEGWDEIALFARSRKEWFAKFCDLNHGIPSSDTIRRVISRIKPEAFEKAFRNWISTIGGKIEGIVAIDGKTICNKTDHSTLHMLSAYSDSLGVSIGQVDTGNKGGEYEAIPKLLKDLEIEGCLITIDAGGCYKEIAKTIVCETEADYLLQVKKNQPTLHSELVEYFSDCNGDYSNRARKHMRHNKGHGREETRTSYYSDHVKKIPSLKDWEGAMSFGMIICERKIKNETTREKHYYICSRKLSASKLGLACRKHWGIENKLHWVLDTTFCEDGNRIRRDQGQQNLSVSRKISLALLKADNSKLSIKQRKFMASLDEKYLSKLLGIKEN